ncbi:hypothetical protein [Phenylobacterium sp.]|uniref:hypothetical protein n=1 Tax=Phenylobacterium sp. TaxID=1871053 RepID=UPI0035B05F6B
MDKDSELELKRSLFLSANPQVQQQAREVLQSAPDYLSTILEAFLHNPFLRLAESERDELVRRAAPLALRALVATRDAAVRSTTPKYVVCCMPKSGSSFLQSALAHAFDLPVGSLTTFTTPTLSSRFGMNSREQELDEMAIAKAVIMNERGFVAQHHTRYSSYLGLQFQLFGLSPVVTTRNVLDAIVSFDDMFAERGEDPNDWIGDSQFAMPQNYRSLPVEDRYTLLCHSLGVWLIAFFLSWKRCERQGLIPAPLMIRYEEHTLHPDRLVRALSEHFAMTDEQVARLRAYAEAPDRERSRFNVGRRGRGEEQIPERLKVFLADYAALFSSELSEDDRRYLVR